MPPVSNGPFMVHDKSFSSLVRGKKNQIQIESKNEKGNAIVLFVYVADFVL